MKGDLIRLTITSGVNVGHESIEATKAGRRVTRRVATRGRVKWVEVNEVTRHGREVGNRLIVRLDAIVSIRETTAAEVG